MLFSMHHQRHWGLASSSSRTRKIPSFGERRFICVCVHPRVVVSGGFREPLSPPVLLLLLLLERRGEERRGEDVSSFFVRGFDATKRDDDDDDDGPDFGV